MASSHYLELSTNALRFEPVGKGNSVFFDEANKQVFSVQRVDGVTQVTVKGPDSRTRAVFNVQDKGHVLSIKFSYDQKILAVQRSAKTVDFINFCDGLDSKEYSQSCKVRTAQVIGFNWTNVNEIVFITNQGLEFYNVYPEKHSLKLNKSYGVPVNWFVYLPESSVLLLSSSPAGNIIHPYHFRASSVMRLPKFEVDLVSVPVTQKLALLERDVTIANIYGQLFVVVLRNQIRGTGAEVVLYHLQRDVPAKRTAVLRLNMSGRFAVNIVDNLVVVHHQASKTSMIFDLKCGGEESDGQATYFYPVLAPLAIQPSYISDSESTTDSCDACTPCEMYSPNWIVFQPNIVIDAKLGCLWEVSLKLEQLSAMIQDKSYLIEFLLLRRDCKEVILSVCKQAMIPGRQYGLTTIAKIFDKLNIVYRGYLDAQAALQPQSDPSKSLGNSVKQLSNNNQAVITQSDMYTEVFSVFANKTEIKHKFMVAVLVEYIRSLNQFQIPVEHYLYELVINILVQNKCFYQFHQFFQYHVLGDSKPLACLMLSLERVYPPAYQLALDMLKRLSTANEEIIEALLSNYQLLPALRFIRSIGAEDSASARKFLEAALNTKDKMLFYTVFQFFEQRNIRLRGSPDFAPAEYCDVYVKKFQELFGNKK